MKKIICMVLALVLCVGLLAGCGGTKTEPAKTEAPKAEAPKTEAPKEGNMINTGSSTTAESKATPPPKEAEYYDSLTTYVYNKIAIIDPLNPGAGTAQSGVIGHLLYDQLVYYAIDGTYEPMLATEWSTDDYVHFNFKLREGVKYHNGEPFSADDVAFSIDAAKEATGSYMFTTFNQVESYEIVNDYEINLTLKAKNIDFIYDITNPTTGILNREAYEGGAENPGWIGTGPFKVKDMIPNDSIVFEANEDYWGDKALTKTFTLRYIAEDTARMIMLENGEFDICQLDQINIPKYANDPRFEINSYMMDNCHYVSFNMKKPITGDLNFRLACAYAIDRETIMQITQNGYAKVVDCGSFWGNNTAYKDRDLPLREQDLEKAKEYLAKSSYNGEKLTVTAHLPQTIAVAQVVLQQLTDIGINVEMNQLDAPSMATYGTWENNDFDIVCSSGAWTPLASSCKSYLYPGLNTNKALYDNPEVTALIDEAAGTPDGPERQAIYYKIQEIVYDEIPYLGIQHGGLYFAAHHGVGGVVFFPTNHIDYSGIYRLKDAG